MTTARSSLVTQGDRIQQLHLFLGKSTKTAATRAALLTPICTESFVGLGFVPDPTGGAYSVPPDSLAIFRGGGYF